MIVGELLLEDLGVHVEAIDPFNFERTVNCWSAKKDDCYLCAADRVANALKKL